MKVDSQIKCIVSNLNDKLNSITIECIKEETYPEYIDKKLKSMEWNIKALRNRVDMALSERKEL